jgi:16S rRNA (guanine(966)-N(2))-methyltransferase RsmD
MGSLRVISGKARGRHLKDVPGDTTRPITDRVKEAVFNILSNDIAGASFLDLFGGTGAVGIEALSRGAGYVRFVEINRQAQQVIQENLTSTNLLPGSHLVRGDAFRLLKQSPDRSFDYIFIAPPQYKEMWIRAMQLLDENPGWLAEDGWVLVQIHPVEYQELHLNNLVEFQQRDYGSTIVVFYANPALLANDSEDHTSNEKTGEDLPVAEPTTVEE